MRLLLLILVCFTGCAPVPIGFDSPSEIRRLDAVVVAARQQDTSPETIRHLIEQLDSFDSAMRLLTIRTLKQFTGQTLGYDPLSPRWERDLAVDRWVSWYMKTYGDDSTDSLTEGSMPAGNGNE